MSRLKDFHTPVFWAEGHPGKLNREGWVIEVSGLCVNPKTFTWQELIALPKSIADAMPSALILGKDSSCNI